MLAPLRRGALRGRLFAARPAATTDAAARYAAARRAQLAETRGVRSAQRGRSGLRSRIPAGEWVFLLH